MIPPTTPAPTGEPPRAPPTSSKASSGFAEPSPNKPPPGGTPIAPPPRAPVATAPTPEIGDLFTTGTDEAKGYFVVVAGPPKYGKTTFALGAPSPVFLLTDRGGLKSAPRSIKRVVPDSWTALMAAARALRDKPHTHGAVVLDTVFKAESLLVRHLCEKDGKASLRSVGGGFGAGYEMMASAINELVDIFFTLNERGIHTIVISQIEHKTVKDASLDDYEKTALALAKQTSIVWTAAADVNMFVQPEMKERERIEAKDKEDRVKVDFTGRAICHVRPASGIDAGNRLFLESPMIYSWAALMLGAAEGDELKDKLFAKLNTLPAIEREKADFRLNAAGWSRASAIAEINAASK